MSADGQQRVCLGAVSGAHGVRGDVRLKVFTQDPRDIGAYGPVSTEDGLRRFDVSAVRVSGNKVTARLSGIGARDQAEALKGTRLYVDRSTLPETEEEEWYHADLVGLDCFDTEGQLIGAVTGIHDFGAGDIVEIEDTQGNGTVLIPFTKECVPSIDLEGGRLVVQPMPEMEDDENPEARLGAEVEKG